MQSIRPQHIQQLINTITPLYSRSYVRDVRMIMHSSLQQAYINGYSVKRYAEKIGVKGFVFHDLRHTFAVNYLLADGDIYSLSKFLGHSNIQTTCDKYLHFTEDLNRKASQHSANFIQSLCSSHNLPKNL